MTTTTRTIEQILDTRLRATRMRVDQRNAALAADPTNDKMAEAKRLADEALVLVQREVDSQQGLPVEPVPYEPSTTFAIKRYAAVLWGDSYKLTADAAMDQAWADERARWADWNARYGETDDELGGDEDETEASQG